MASTQYDASLQPLRNLNINVYVLDYNFNIVDEISGVVTSANVSVDADADIRRAANISMLLEGDNVKRISSIQPYNHGATYTIGDVVTFNDQRYQCTSTQGNANISGIFPTDSLYWSVYSTTQNTLGQKYWTAGNPYWFDKYIKIEVGIEDKEYYSGKNTPQYDNTVPYQLNDVVRYNNALYKCINVVSSSVNLTDIYGNYLKDSASENLIVNVGGDYICGVPPFDTEYWEMIEQYTWANQGIYMINAPSISYNSTENILSFQAVDLMSKLTGMRNGYLEGMTYQIEANTSIVHAMRATLQEQGFTSMVLDTPPTEFTPTDINIDIGSTAYDMLAQLRDINANWEMFFDVDGVFRFQEIPSGNERPIFGNEVWDKVGTNYSLSTSFEDVKNYVEIVGKQIEPDETAVSTTYSNSTVTVTLSRPFTSYYSASADTNVTWYIGFTIGAVSGAPTRLSTPITTIVVKDANSSTHTITIPNSQEAKIYYNNESYFVRLVFSSSAYLKGEFGGYLQPRSIAFESNPESPFYVGTATEHVSDFNHLPVRFVPEGYDDYIAEISVNAHGNKISLDLTAMIGVEEFNRASEGSTWQFKVGVSLDNGIPVQAVDIFYGGSGTQALYTHDNEQFVSQPSEPFYVQEADISESANSPIYVDNSSTWAEIRRITLDYSSEYLLVVQKVNDAVKMFAYYYPLPSRNWVSPTTQLHSLPKFSKMVRGVCSGDEYDNIYTNDLTNQRAKYELYLQCRLHDTITINCVPLYWLDVNDVVGFKIDTNGDEIPWIIKSISTDLSATGTQSITAMRYYPLYN